MSAVPPHADEARSRVFDELEDAILIADDERRYVDVNPAACALLGLSRTELLGRRVDDVLPRPPDANVDALWLAFLADGVQVGRFTLASPSGDVVVDYRARARIAPGRHMSILRNVTEQARATEAARLRETQFRRLADHLPYVVARFGRSGRHLFVNRTVQDVLGVAPDAFLGKTNEELGMPAANVAEWNRLIERAFAGEEVKSEFTIEGSAPGASPRTFESRVVPELGRDGVVESALAVVHDVTAERSAVALLERERRDAEQARALLEALVGTAPVGFGFLDRDLRFRMVNPALAEMNGIPPEAHLGRTPMELLPGIAADFTKQHAEQVLASGTPLLDLEVRGETPKEPGVPRIWLEDWYPVRVNGEVTGVGLVVDEVTERRRAEADQQAVAEQRERLMAIVSHDLRSPLGAIAMAANVIGMDVDAPKQTVAMADRIGRMTKRMSALIEQLLDFVRIGQGGRLLLQRSAMDLTHAVAQAAEECRLLHPKVQVDVEAQGNTAGEWDEDRMLQVVANLVFNAAEHGDGRLVVRVDGQDRGRVRMQVVNGGRPIPQELLTVLFEPFRRGTEGFARRAGLGLGLYISKSIVEAHGGTIDVRSDEQLTTFTVDLPRR